jgi:hypothetical protein
MAAQKVALTQKVGLKCRAGFRRFSRIWTPTAQDLHGVRQYSELSRN